MILLLRQQWPEMNLKNVFFGIFLIIVGVDIFFGEPFISKGVALDKNIGILFWIGGILFVLYEAKNKVVKHKKRNTEKNKETF